MTKPELNGIKRAILEHLSVNREAGFPLSEIVRWWVMENQADKVRVALREFVDRERREVVLALEELKEDGYVEETFEERPGFRLLRDVSR